MNKNIDNMVGNSRTDDRNIREAFSSRDAIANNSKVASNSKDATSRMDISYSKYKSNSCACSPFKGFFTKTVLELEFYELSNKITQ
jgi:hypothetical protein